MWVKEGGKGIFFLFCTVRETKTSEAFFNVFESEICAGFGVLFLSIQADVFTCPVASGSDMC